MKKRCYISAFLIVFLSLTGCLAAPDTATAVKAAKSIAATRAEQAPVIDGRLDDACWQNAVTVDNFTKYSQQDSPHPEQTAGRICFDEKNIYLAVECEVADMDYFRAQLAQTGNKFYWQRCGNIQVFFDPGNTGEKFYQYCLHPNGTAVANIPHKRGKQIAPTLPRDVTFKSTLTKTGYIIEAAFPLYMFTPQPGGDKTWGFNLVREHDTSGQGTLSSETYSCWHFTQQHGFMTAGYAAELVIDADLSPYYMKTNIQKLPSPEAPEIAIDVDNNTEKDFSGNLTVTVINPDKKTKTHTKPFSLKTGQNNKIALEHTMSQNEAGSIYETVITNAAEQDVYFARTQSFFAKAIIKDVPFKAREMYLKDYPQYCPTETDLIYNGSLYVSPDRALPRGITYAHGEKTNLLYGKEHDLRLCFEFPEGTEVTGLCMGNGEDARNNAYPTVETFTRQGQKWNRYELKLEYIQNLHHSEGIHHAYFKTNLPVGESSKAYYYMTWTGGRQASQEIRVESISVPKVKPPRNMYVGIWSLGPARLKMLCPNFPEDFKSLGLNAIGLTYYGHIDENSDHIKSYYEYGDPIYKAARDNGIYIYYSEFKPHTPEVQYGHPAYWAGKDPDARAVDINGQTLPWGSAYVVCPSYRGKYYKDALKLLTTHEQLKRWPASLFSIDIEMYGGRGTQVCFCDRCLGLFKDWFAENYPYLEYIDPAALNKEVKRSESFYKEEPLVTTKYPGQYYAWTQFKIEQFADMIAGILNTLKDVVGDVRTAPFDEVIFADWGAIYPGILRQEGAMYGPYTNSEAIKIWAVGAYGPAGLLSDPKHTKKLNEYYMTALDKRIMFYDTPPSSLYEPGASSGFATKPERSKYYLLETTMSGATGILIYHYSGVEGKQLAINAEVFGSLRLIDDITTQGKRIKNLSVEGKDMHARGFQIDDERVVLVGDNYVATDYQEAVLTCPVEETVGVYDLLKRKKLGELTPNNNTIKLVIKDLDDRARFLYIGNNWEERLAW